jgi:hypothetical protein
MVPFLVLALTIVLVAPAYSWDNRGHGGRHDNRGGHRDNYLEALGAGIIIGTTAAIANALIPYNPYPPAYNPYPPVYQNCTRKVVYGYWTQDYYGRPHWVTTRVDYVPAPCRY